jgi:hypothetical protein
MRRNRARRGGNHSRSIHPGLPPRGPSPVQAERLEERQLLTLIIDVRATDGSKLVVASAVGQVVNLQVWAEVTDPQNDPADDGFQGAFSSFLSTGVGPATPIDGNLSATLLTQFTANGSSSGISQDLNGDGNLDVGSNTPTSATGFLDARSGSALGDTSPGAVIGAVGTQGALEFEIATLTYTVTSLASGGETDINSRPRSIEPGSDAGTWFEDLVAVDPATDPPVAGTPVRIVAPAPVAGPISASAVAGAPTAINLLTAVQSLPGANAASLHIVTQPADGTATANTNGSATFTASLGAAGLETFDYQIADTNGQLSNLATVSVNVTAANVAPPTLAGSSSLALVGQANTVDVSSSVASALPLSAYTATATTPAHGTVVASTPFSGAFTYTPSPGYVGTDSFTYTLTAPGGQISNSATVSLSIGAQLSSAKGAARILAMLSGSRPVDTLTLTGPGAATVYFTGGGNLSERAGRASVTPAAGAAVELSGSIALAGTTFASAVSLTGQAVNLSQITDAAPLGRLIAATSTLAGSLSLGGLSLLQVAAMNDATATLGPAATAAGVTIHSGAIASSTLSTSAPLTLASGQLAAASITAPLARALHLAGMIDSSVQITGSDARAQIVSTAAIAGSILAAGGDALTLAAPSITASTVAAASAASLALGAGGSSLTLTIPGALGTLSAANLTSSTLTLGSARTIHISGNFSGDALLTTGNVAAISASAMTDDTLVIGATAAPLASATAASLGTATLASLRVTSGAAGAFADTTILAHTITSAALGQVTTANAGASFGLAAVSIRSASFTAAGVVQRLNATTLKQPAVFGDFEIELL